jgi:hypothetical protein
MKINDILNVIIENENQVLNVCSLNRGMAEFAKTVEVVKATETTFVDRIDQY